MMRLPVIPTIIVAAAIAVMIGLGAWQLQRKGEKEALIAQLAANRGLPVMAFPRPPVGDQHLFRRATGFCLEPTGWQERGGRDAKGRKGFRLIALCRTGAEGPGIAVQIGVADQPGMAKGEGPAWRGGEVTGIIAHLPDDRSLFGDMFSRQPPRTLMLIADTPAPGLRANAAPDLSSVPNNHLAYAVQWFLFAGIAAVIYGLVLRRRMTSNGLQASGAESPKDL